jgi:5-methyltetrahydrofolate--homocysteine methyltransferase
MPACLRELDARGLHFPVIIGGAAINRGFGRRILLLEEDRAYDPCVVYCKDAFEGLETVDQLVDPARRELLVERIRDEAVSFRDAEAQRAAERAAAPVVAVAEHSAVRRDAPIPTPPFWGARVLRGIPIDEVVPHIDKNSLFKMGWQFRGIRDPEEWERMLRTELEPRLARSIAEARSDGHLDLQAAYGYWPALADGDTVLIYNPDDPERVVARLTFPRQPAQHRLCLADYLRPVSEAGGERDVVALQLATTGPRASELSEALQREDRYDDMLRVHGFATQMAEATAEHVHQRIRAELGLGPDQGRRYSPGYASCPDLEGNRVLLELLPAAEVGVTLTDAAQLVPEQSTVALVMHHPEARYFDIHRAPTAAAV